MIAEKIIDQSVDVLDIAALDIVALDMDARGIARRDGKVVFVEGALPGEQVTAHTVRRKPSYEIARVAALRRASSQRVTPRCPHFGVCGGCAMQHLDASTQVAIKQRVLEDTLWHIGKLRAPHILPPLHGPSWGYRYRARLGQKRRRAGRVSRTQEQFCRRHARVPRAAASRQ